LIWQARTYPTKRTGDDLRPRIFSTVGGLPGRRACARVMDRDDHSKYRGPRAATACLANDQGKSIPGMTHLLHEQ
jgi:hypothetical protein